MRDTIPQWTGLWLVALILSMPIARADDSAASGLRDPVASRNLSPLYASLGIPVMAAARSPGPGEWSLAWSLQWASHSVREVTAGRTLEFDGETRRQDLLVSVGVSDRLSAQLNLPHMYHGGGQLDGPIDDWHGFWGLPDGNRAFQPDDQLRFDYFGTGTGGAGFSLGDSSSGFGDAELSLSYLLSDGPARQLAVFAQYKFDTGNVRDFTGSGDDALAIGARFSGKRCFIATLSCHLHAGVADVGHPGAGPEVDRKAFFAGASVAWALRDTVAIFTQLDAHSVVYEVAPLDANGAPLWLTVGLRWMPARAWLVDFQISEDLAVGAAPDVTFRTALSRRF